MQYLIKRSSRSRSIRIEITPQAEVLVTAPKLIPEFLIKSFVSQKTAWIEKSLRQVKRRQSKLNADQLYIFDKLYLIKINDQAKKISITVRGETLQINNLNPKSDKIRAEQLERFLKNTVHKYIIERCAQLAKKMNIEYQRVTLRGQKSRWGSCSSRGNLNFNWRLVHYPVEVIDYVLIHELAHRIQLNHSAKFWAIVAKFDADYKQHRKTLTQKRY